MKIRRFLIPLLPFIFLGMESLSQGTPNVFSQKNALSSMVMDRWTYKEGLSSNNINNIYQDYNDFIWLTSFSGILRFDGLEFTHFGPHNEEALTSKTSYAMYEDVDSTLWFTTEASGVVGYKKGKFFPHPANPQLPKGTNSIYRSSNGDYWIGSNNLGLYKYTSTQQIVKIDHVPNETVLCIAEDNQGSVWVGTQGKGLYKLNNGHIKRFTVAEGLTENVIQTLFFDKEGVLYVGTPSGLCTIINDVISIDPKFTSRSINKIMVDDSGTIWSATERGLIRINEELDIYEHFESERNLLGRRTTSLYFDKEGSLWAGTYKSGLLRLKKGKITNISRFDGLSFNHVNTIYRKNHTYFIGTEDGTLNLFDDRKSRVVERIKFHDVGIRDIYPDENDHIWVGSYQGLFEYNPSTRTTINHTPKLPSNDVRLIYAYDGNKWIGTRSGGLIRMDKFGKVKVFNKVNGFSSDYILSIQADKQGNIIVGTHSGGLMTINGQDEIFQFDVTKDDSGLIIFNARIDDEDHIWMATNFGLYYYDRISFNRISFEAELDNEKFFDVVVDEKDRLWLTSDIGIVEVLRSNIEDHLGGNLSRVPYELYNESDGMANRECTGATRTYFNENTGKIWVPTLGGISVVDPSANLKNNLIPKIKITGATVDEKAVNIYKKNIQIAPGSFRYAFTFTSLSYLVPNRVQFKYKLEGIDEEWKFISGARKVEYTNLPYGDYTLLVQGSNGHGTWNEQGASLSFEVLPFFYETRWFLFIIFCVLVGVLWLLYRWRIKDIKERNVALTKINSELDSFVYRASHDLRTPVTSTMSLVDIALGETSMKDKDEYIKMIDQCAHKLDHIILDIIEYSKNKNKDLEYNKFSIRELIDDILHDVRYVGDIKDVAFKLNTNKEFITSDRARIRIILSNFIANAIQYKDIEKPKPYIHVDVIQDKENISMSVADNGIGIPESETNKIFNMFYRGNHKSKGSGLGLYIVNETAQKLNGIVQINSQIGLGSTFVITIPVKSAK